MPTYQSPLFKDDHGHEDNLGVGAGCTSSVPKDAVKSEAYKRFEYIRDNFNANTDLLVMSRESEYAIGTVDHPDADEWFKKHEADYIRCTIIIPDCRNMAIVRSGYMSTLF